MYWNFSRMIDLFSADNTAKFLLDGKWGLEKEAVRVTSKGDLALTPHPEAFGNKDTNPHVTTDFSESQMELITPAYGSIEKTFGFLNSLQEKADKVIDSELLWPLSMPGPLPVEKKIPIARYKDNKDGKLKEIYRSGLALRYGKKMQMISGIHYNFSFQQRFWENLLKKLDIRSEKQSFTNEAHVALVRNILRYRWLLIYLFGSSPAADKSYQMDIFQKKGLHNHNVSDFLRENATSLRMSRLGYDNASQNSFPVSYNSLNEYIRDIRKILFTKNDTYSKLGVFKDGIQLQLNDHQLQLENEYYAPVRFKQTPNPGESQLDALEKRGVDYLEIRTFDLNPFEKNGISMEQLYFMQVFMLFCLFEQSRYFKKNELELSNTNAHKTALMGRKDGLKLTNLNGRPITIKQWGTKIIGKLRIVAHMLDKIVGDDIYGNSIEVQNKKIMDNTLLASSKMIDEMKTNNESYLAFNLRKANENRAMVI